MPKSSLEYRVVKFADLKPAMEYYESGHAKDAWADPEARYNFSRYEELEKNDNLLCIAAINGKVRGYCICSASIGLNDPKIMALAHSLFLDRDYRSFEAARGMIRFAEDRLRDFGIKNLYIGMRNLRLVKFFEKIGYKQSEIVMRINL